LTIMSDTSTRPVNEAAYDLFDRWLAHRQQESDVVAGHGTVEPDVVETDEDFEEFAHPAPALGGVAAAPPSLGPEPTGEAGPLPAAAPSPVTVGASVPHPPEPAAAPAAAPIPGLVLFTPRRGLRPVVTGAVALLAVGAVVSGFLAWLAPAPTSIGVAVGLAVAALLAGKLRARTTGSRVTIEHGVLRIVQGDTRHQFPLAGAHPPIDVLGEPGQRSWRVLIQRRGMSPFVITRTMVDPVDFTEALRQFRPQA
jgi:hypothetical protein